MKLIRIISIITIGMFIIILTGTIGFQYFENLSALDALWLTVVTILTVGYGDIVPQSAEGKIFALIIVPIGIVLFAYALSFITATIIEGELSETVGRKRMEQKIKKLKKHIIICGLGRVGRQVALKLIQENVPIVVIEQNVSHIELFSNDILYIEGDATQDNVLYQAGITEAAGIVAALPHDANNVLIALTAKEINPAIQIVARAERSESEKKLRRAGADKVINPSNIGGRRIAMSILRPSSIEYMDTILHGENEEFGIEEITVQENFVLVGRKIKDTKIREKYGVTIVAIKRNNHIISNPKADETLQVNDVIIIVGTKAQFIQFEKAVKT